MKLYPPIQYFFNRYRLLFVLLIIIILVSSIFEGIGIAAFFPIFLALFGDLSASEGGFLGIIVKISSAFPGTNPIYSAGLLLISVYLLKTGLNILRMVFTIYVEHMITYRTKSQIMHMYSQAHYQFFLDTQQGNLAYRSLNASASVGDMLIKLSQAISDGFKFVAIFTILLITVPYTTCILAFIALLYMLTIFRVSKKVLLVLGEGQLHAGTEQNVIANEFFTGIRNIIVFQSFSWWLDRFTSACYTLGKLRAKQNIFVQISRPIVEFVFVVFMIGFLLSLWAFDSDNFSNALPKLGIVALALAQIMPSLINIGRSRMEIMALVPDVSATHEILTGALPIRSTGNKQIHNFNDSIVFKSVTFGYPGRNILFNNFDLTINQGQHTAIVGASGSGKTTIINLLLGMFQNSSGTIEVDGIPLHQLNHGDWLHLIGLVTQETFTFHSTIAENILFGRDFSRDEIIEAAKISGAHSFITRLNDKYDTLVGERGMKLSGGQQQRISLSRAILPNPSILIFDEATSSLDSISEHEIQESIESISQGRTVITIAHRLSTITKADKIIVVSNGQVVEQGTHDLLIANRKDYFEMVSRQTNL